jgi:hypothetical protein
MTEVRQAGLRSGLTALALAAAILLISVLEQQAELRQSIILRDYDAAGAATFLVEVRTADHEIEELVAAVRRQPGITAAEAPYRGGDLEVTADTAFLVFQNPKQQEYLGASTAVLGVTESFDLARDYYETVGRQSTNTAGAQLGIPLIVTDGVTRPPSRSEVLVPAAVANYVGVRPGARASIELKSEIGRSQPVIHRYPDIEVIGVFDATGPDEARFAPFWRLAARGRDVLTVRRPDAESEPRTTLPIVLNAELLRGFLTDQQKRQPSGIMPDDMVGRRQLVIRAQATHDVPAMQEVVKQLLIARGLFANCPAISLGSFCIVLPERNNFAAAQREQAKFSAGAGFFTALLLALCAIGNAGLQLQAVISRWRDHAVLQALGFTPSQLFLSSLLRLFVLFGTGIVGSAIIWLMTSPVFPGSFFAFAVAAALCAAASLFAAMPALLLPLRSHPGRQIRELT